MSFLEATVRLVGIAASTYIAIRVLDDVVIPLMKENRYVR